MMQMRNLNLMTIIEIARKCAVSYTIIYLGYYLLGLRYSSILYDVLIMMVLLRNLLCIILLICTTRFVSELLDIKTNHMTVVLRSISIHASISDILSKEIRIIIG